MSDVRQKSRFMRSRISANMVENLGSQFRKPFASKSRSENDSGAPLLPVFGRSGYFERFPRSHLFLRDV